MIKKLEVQFTYSGSSIILRFTLHKRLDTKNNIYILPNGKEGYIADIVLKKIMQQFENRCKLNDENFDQLMTLIDESGSEMPMVPVSRVGPGPTDMSGKYTVNIIQKINNGTPYHDSKQRKLTFTLPVSQIKNVKDDELAAPLWLIEEKLKQKANWVFRSIVTGHSGLS